MKATRKLWRRLCDWVSGWVNVLDAEDPPSGDPLELGLARLRAALGEATAALAQAVVAQKQLAQQLTAVQTQHTQYGVTAERAVAAGDEDGARLALRRQTELEPRLASLTSMHASAVAGCVMMRSRLGEQKARCDEVASTIAVMSSRERAARAASTFGTAAARGESSSPLVGDLQRRIDEAEAMAEVLADVASRRDRWSDLEARLDALRGTPCP